MVWTRLNSLWRFNSLMVEQELGRAERDRHDYRKVRPPQLMKRPFQVVGMAPLRCS